MQGWINIRSTYDKKIKRLKELNEILKHVLALNFNQEAQNCEITNVLILDIKRWFVTSHKKSHLSLLICLLLLM